MGGDYPLKGGGSPPIFERPAQFFSSSPPPPPKQISHTSSLPFLKLLLLPPFKFLYTLFLLLYHLLGSPSNEHLWLRSWPFSGGVSPFADFL